MDIDLGLLSAAVNLISALILLASMQIIAREPGFTSLPKIMRLIQRGILGCLILTMLWNAGYTLKSDTVPRMSDLIERMAMLGAIAFSVLRHFLATARIAELRQEVGIKDAKPASVRDVPAHLHWPKMNSGQVAHH